MATKKDTTSVPKAKRHKLLLDLTSEIKKGFIEDVVEVYGRKFKLATLTEEEENWADNYVISSTAAGLLSSMRVPRLACAIKEIDGIPVEDLFEFPEPQDEAQEKEFEAIKSSEVKMKYWIRGQMMLWLAEDTNRPFILKLWDGFMKLDKRREEVVSSIPN
jgi:hypothetical protein